MTDKPSTPCELAAADGSPLLCYVDEQWAYFTTQPISQQWGDDWDDVPYEHNAGTPYDYSDHDKAKGRKPFAITKVAYDGDFDTPCSNQYSVEMINAGTVAWLRTSQWRTGKLIAIHAGTTLERFCELIREGGGNVYVANDKVEVQK